MQQPDLVAQDVVLGRGPRRFLDAVSLRAAAGEVLAVSGPSGAGKTTLLGVLGGLTRPTSGTVTFAGGPVGDGRGRPSAGTAYVLQSYGLVATLTAEENVAIALRARGVPGVEATERALAALDRVRVAELADRLVDELSGGQVQRVAVARALVTEPDLLLADEPTSELDEANRDVVVDELRLEAERGAVVVLATHDAEVAERCHHEVRLDEGRLERVAEAVVAEPGHEHDMFKPPDRSRRRAP